MTESSEHARLPESSDTRLLVTGVVAFLVLVAYLAIAFVRTHATNGLVPSEVSKVAPWTPAASKLTPILRANGKYTVRVTPATRGQTFGAVVQTLVPNPTPGRRFVFGVWLKGSPAGQVGVELNEFRPGVSRYPVETTVPVTPKWRHFTFTLRVRGAWLGLAIYVYRINKPRRTWFAIRGLT